MSSKIIAARPSVIVIGGRDQDVPQRRFVRRRAGRVRVAEGILALVGEEGAVGG